MSNTASSSVPNILPNTYFRFTIGQDLRYLLFIMFFEGLFYTIYCSFFVLEISMCLI